MARLVLSLLLLTFLILFPVLSRAECECSVDEEHRDKSKALPLKIAAIFAIFFGGSIGVCVPIVGRWLPAFGPDTNAFFIVKAFAAGVILSTGFVHILPDAYENLTSPCLPSSPWQDFPFTGFVAMVAAIGVMMIETAADGYYTRAHFTKALPVTDAHAEHGSHVHVHTHAMHGHAHGAAPEAGPALDLVRHRVVSQVLELGILVHSVIIGISLGASENSSTIKPLVIALAFHQLFEGMGLGGCIVQAEFKVKSMAVMIIFFSLTTPVGIGVGIGISSVYDENSPTALIVEGILNAAAAGILIYMALVDLVASDFKNPRVQRKGWLQLGLNMSLMLGAGFMSMLAKWA